MPAIGLEDMYFIVCTVWIILWPVLYVFVCNVVFCTRKFSHLVGAAAVLSGDD